MEPTGSILEFFSQLEWYCVRVEFPVLLQEVLLVKYSRYKSVHVKSSLPICGTQLDLFCVPWISFLNSVSLLSERCTSLAPYWVSTCRWPSWAFVSSTWCRSFCRTICMCSHPAARVTVTCPLPVTRKIRLIYWKHVSHHLPWTSWRVSVSVIKACQVGVHAAFSNSSFSKYILKLGMAAICTCHLSVLWDTRSGLIPHCDQLPVPWTQESEFTFFPHSLLNSSSTETDFLWLLWSVTINTWILLRFACLYLVTCLYLHWSWDVVPMPIHPLRNGRHNSAQLPQAQAFLI